MKNYDSRLTRVEKAIKELLNPYEAVVIIVNKSNGETEEMKLAEKEKELQRKINKKGLIVVTVSGLEKI